MNEATSETTNTYRLPPPAAESRIPSRPREEAIRSAVLRALGIPAELVRVAVVPLWGDHFRVNVWTGRGSGSGIPHSYFVTADAVGSVLRADPPIQRQY